MNTPPTVIEQHWDIHYQHTLDEVQRHFFDVVRDEGRLVGIRCPVCDRVLAPPRSFCDRDFVRTAEWVDLGDEGVIELFTIVALKTPGLPDPPYVLAYVRPDGADTALLNLLEGVDLTDIKAAAERIKIGARVKISFNETRTGRVDDFRFVLED